MENNTDIYLNEAGNGKNALEVRKLCKGFKSFNLSDVTFNVPKGYITGFIGSNGAGKTTTIKLMLNILGSDSGNVTVFGENVDIMSNESIGVVMDMPMYSDEWTLLDVEKAVSPFYVKWDKGLFAQYLKKFGLDPSKKVKELSRGMKVKLQIAAALSHDAKLLILDEPTSGLDPVARDEICDLLREFVSSEDGTKSVFYSTHITSDLEKTADFIVFIQNGQIIFSGAKDDLLEKYARVTGGLGELSREQKEVIIGYREHKNGFEGLIETVNIEMLPKSVLSEEATLDEIIIFINKGEQNDE